MSGEGGQPDTECCVDCEAGRAMGCGTFCCRLLVRIGPEDARRIYPDRQHKRIVDKGADGYCEFMDRETFQCGVWEQRPAICRAYDCNTDELLQVAVRDGVRGLVELVKRAGTTWIPPHQRVRVPVLDEDN